MRVSRREARHRLELRQQVAKAMGFKSRRGRLPRQLPPKAIELAYFAALRGILYQAKALVKDRLLPQLDRWLVKDPRVHTDAADDEVNALIDQMAEQFLRDNSVEKLKQVSLQYAKRTSDYQREELHKVTREALGVDVVLSEPWLDPVLRAHAAENVALIRSVPEQYFTEVEKLVLRGVREGVRPETIAADIEDRFGVAESRAALIAKDQTNKLFGDLNKERQHDLGVEKFVWRTSNDERVRESHAELEGEVFSWDDPPTVEGEVAIPGSAILCRCTAEPVLDPLPPDESET